MTVKPKQIHKVNRIPIKIQIDTTSRSMATTLTAAGLVPDSIAGSGHTCCRRRHPLPSSLQEPWPGSLACLNVLAFTAWERHHKHNAITWHAQLWGITQIIQNMLILMDSHSHPNASTRFKVSHSKLVDFPLINIDLIHLPSFRQSQNSVDVGFNFLVTVNTILCSLYSRHTVLSLLHELTCLLLISTM